MFNSYNYNSAQYNSEISGIVIVPAKDSVIHLDIKDKKMYNRGRILKDKTSENTYTDTKILKDKIDKNLFDIL
ncbi:MAG: hypothetical protein DRP74_07285 [Candidatus Omnitrophota bacterium]|nr:MAG: hypothetical protein DRP74_07285 [Candidatus Omnitrophota bacterium]